MIFVLHASQPFLNQNSSLISKSNTKFRKLFKYNKKHITSSLNWGVIKQNIFGPCSMLGTVQQHSASHCNYGHPITSSDNYHHHSVTVNSIEQQSASHCNGWHPTTSAATYHHHSATVNSIEQQSASHCNSWHPTTSAHTYHHRSATVNSIQQHLSSQWNCGHPATTCNQKLIYQCL